MNVLEIAQKKASFEFSPIKINRNIIFQNTNNSFFLERNTNGKIKENNIELKQTIKENTIKNEFFPLLNNVSFTRKDNTNRVNEYNTTSKKSQLYPMDYIKKSYVENKQLSPSIKTFLNKKRKLMSTEELELDNIEKERAKTKKLLETYKKIYQKSLNYTPIRIMPKPLTTFRPFKLSSNNNIKYLKERSSNTENEIIKLNQKIRLKMQQKIEAFTDKKTREQILLNNTDFVKDHNQLYDNQFKAPFSINKFDNDKVKNTYRSFFINDKNFTNNGNEKEKEKGKENNNDFKKNQNIFSTPQKTKINDNKISLSVNINEFRSLSRIPLSSRIQRYVFLHKDIFKGLTERKTNMTETIIDNSFIEI